MIRKLTFALAALVLAAIPTLAQSPTGSWQVDAYPVDAAGHPAATTVKVPFSGVPIAPAQIPAPTASTLGGVKSATAPTNNFQTGIDTAGNPIFVQPAAGNVSGLTAGATAAAGQLPGTATNDNATAGNVGEYVSAGGYTFGAVSGVTITIASPAVVTWPSALTGAFQFTGNGCAALVFTTTGALPTGITSGTVYYVIGSSISGNTFRVATTCDNAIAGTALNTSGTQSGTHSGNAAPNLTTATQFTAAGSQLSAGDWNVECVGGFLPAATTAVSYMLVSASLLAVGEFSSPWQFGGSVYASAGTVLGNITTLPSIRRRFSLATPTSVYCTNFASFGTSTLGGGSFLTARRTR